MSSNEYHESQPHELNLDETTIRIWNNFSKYDNDVDNISNDTNQNDKSTYFKRLFGFVVIYGFILSTIPYYLSLNAPLSIFFAFIVNVDIICNVLAINYPTIFGPFYNPNFKTISEYLSYNIVSLVSLSGIFIYGIYHSKQQVSDKAVFASLITMAVLTFILPTQGIPYMTRYVLSNDKSLKPYKLEVTSIISSIFVFVEWFIIHTFIMY